MRRHLIAARLGPADPVAIAKATDEVLTRFNLISGQRRLDYGMGHAIESLQALNVFPSERALDLLVLAAHVHAADTRISRSRESQDSWTREIRLVVPVSDVAVWTGCSAMLQRMLDFLTGDRWTVQFRSRPTGLEQIAPRRPADAPASSYRNVNLFSGGLDSLIGAIDAIEVQESPPLFVSHAGEGATSEAQRILFDQLTRHYHDTPISRLRVWMAFPTGLVQQAAVEDTTRGRSFPFFALGAFAGSGLGDSFALRAPENGLIALNVPLDPLRVGSLSTRTTHPFYIARWNELLSSLDLGGHIENPYWDRTKGEMVASCANPELLVNLIPDSLSCSSPTKGHYLGHGIEHCGYCLPCLIRRAALHASLGNADDLTEYKVSDLRAHALNTRQAQGQQVRSFQFAIERLRRRPNLASMLIHKPGPLTDEADRLPALAAVYRRGLEEVGALLDGVITRPAGR
jgi:hypothetical protein